MRQRFKLLLMALLLACSVLLLTSCVGKREREFKEYKDDTKYMGDEFASALSSINDAYSLSSGYFETESDLSPEDALVVLWCYVEGEETEYATMEKAQEAYSVIEDYLEYSRSKIYSIQRSVEEYFAE